jgi:hypothetical protein
MVGNLLHEKGEEALLLHPQYAFYTEIYLVLFYKELLYLLYR